MRGQLAGSRTVRCVVALSVVICGAAIPQRLEAQWRAAALPGFRFGPPLRAGFALGVVYGNTTGAAEFAGPVALGEVGIGGGRVSAGVLFAGPFVTGIEFLGSAIRTWGSPSQLEPNQTLVGGEVRTFILAVNVGFGAYRPVAGFTDDRRARYYLNVGVGI